MKPPKGSGLEALDRMIRRSARFYSDFFKSYSRSYSDFYNADRLRRNLLSALKKLPAIELPQFTYKPPKVDYHNIVNSFLPPGARLVKPLYPEHAGEIQFADLDGDGRKELIASYIAGDGLKTLVLKKDEVQWYKMAEISCPGFRGIHYRTFADISGEGRKDLLLGLDSGQQSRTLFAYSVSDGDSRKIFSKEYSKMEVLRSPSRNSRDSVALWHEEAPGIYSIELIRWNGIDLEQIDKTRYLASKVLPYYIRKLRQDPADTASWYNLAGTFMDAGDRVNAAKAVRYALEFNPDPVMRDRLMELRQKL
ncbi:MAG TPA: VCBS repeat-containing protein [Clostridiales bacterium]|nr:VCBS repeat-containing protein [Clostridiales bacterium]